MMRKTIIDSLCASINSHNSLINLVKDTLEVETGEEVEVLVRQDTPDYVTIEIA